MIGRIKADLYIQNRGINASHSAKFQFILSLSSTDPFLPTPYKHLSMEIYSLMCQLFNKAFDKMSTPRLTDHSVTSSTVIPIL